MPTRVLSDAIILSILVANGTCKLTKFHHAPKLKNVIKLTKRFHYSARLFQMYLTTNCSLQTFLVTLHCSCRTEKMAVELISIVQ